MAARAGQGSKWLVAMAMFAAAAARAEEGAGPVFDSGDTAWVITASALVLMMTLPGLALFYGGLVRSKNILNVLMQCFVSAGIIGLLWVLVGYSLAFGEGGAFVGDLSRLGLQGIDLTSATENFADPPRQIPEYVFVVFQGMFAIITPALMLGAVAERMKFSAWVAFITLWFVIVYCPAAHMVWASEGWIFQSGAIDFAGGLVVHMTSGYSALVAAILVGKRRGYGKEALVPHSLPLCLIGAALLWTGWYGFNAGSALSASPLAALAFLNTGAAASAAVVGWAAIEWWHRGKPTALGGATAAVAGLVAITPACGAVSPLGAIVVGLGVCAVSYPACTWLKPALGYDDSLDVFGVHALGGTWGALASGLLATGVESNWEQLVVQLQSVVFIIVYSVLLSGLLLGLLKVVFGSLRVADEDELQGLDVSEHGENAYTA